MRKDIDDLARQFTVFQKEMACVTKEEAERSDLFNERVKIFVCGGYNGITFFNSAESYSWSENVWKLEPAMIACEQALSAMKEKRSGPSAFVHGRQIFVAGGRNGNKNNDSIESLDVDKKHIEWIELPVKMPIKCRGHKIVCHENTAILTGGRNGEIVSDGTHLIQLNPAYDTKLLTQMPEPRCYHGCEIIDNQLVIAGGRSSKYIKDGKNTMYVYDINNNECKPMAPLPFAISNMATVSYKDNVILIGGVNEKAQTLNTVIKYDIKTGKTEMLPCLNHKRAGSAAVIIGNVILVMGGYVYETRTPLDSVECLDFNTNVWRELSPMTIKRARAAAVVKPLKQKCD